MFLFFLNVAIGRLWVANFPKPWNFCERLCSNEYSRSLFSKSIWIYYIISAKSISLFSTFHISKHSLIFLLCFILFSFKISLQWWIFWCVWIVYVLNIVQPSLLMKTLHIKYLFKYFILFLIMCVCAHGYRCTWRPEHWRQTTVSESFELLCHSSIYFSHELFSSPTPFIYIKISFWKSLDSQKS